MATLSMLREMKHRSEWLMQFEAAVRRQSTDPDHDVKRRDALDLYREGYTPEQAATKYLQWHHIGVGS